MLQRQTEIYRNIHYDNVIHDFEETGSHEEADTGTSGLLASLLKGFSEACVWCSDTSVELILNHVSRTKFAG